MSTNAIRLAAFLVGIFPLASLATADATGVVSVEQAGECTARVGQTVHFIFRYDGFAGQIITGLEVAIDGKPVREPKVESRPDPKLVDVGQVIFVFRPDRAATYRVQVTPLAGNTKGRPREKILPVTRKE